ncbi:TPA: hypothetical protein DDZ01_03310 [Candidatus Uhrbacteria bacterium]|nr:MAG: hypothetical protein UT94_C0028G0015 [Candidatus Uhrbacteria bacterium GW2011_GWF2_40_263]OGL98322.1 MAG: hypothetical protein A2332_03780 [Candidatus Uhrbacteria bacterium RIFOXYB2_FULL_41_18]HBK34996.1 hypothetical protein [Candidatus Uhrbacteria bacterium]HCB56038.1 hypothetical protein [Candidatus Uhrbacteria bacterium]
MPNFDQTGPQGQGPLTGQGQGNCSQTNQGSVRGFFRGMFGRGRGLRGQGRGRGMGLGQGRRQNFPPKDLS